MTDSTFQLLAIGLYFAAMIAIGVYAYRQTNDLDDYMLAGRKLSPGVAALSAGASDMSGWLLLGVPGAIYATDDRIDRNNKTTVRYRMTGCLRACRTLARIT